MSKLNTSELARLMRTFILGLTKWKARSDLPPNQRLPLFIGRVTFLSFTLSILYALMYLLQVHFSGHHITDHLAQSFLPILFVCGNLLAIVTYRRGDYRKSAQILIVLYLVLCLHTQLDYGIGTPSGLLGIVILITLSGAVASRHTFYMVSMVASLGVLMVYLAHRLQIIPLVKTWTNQDYLFVDVIMFSASFMTLSFIIKKFMEIAEYALNEALNANRLLQEERDNLDLQVQIKTEEIRRLQYERVLELHQLADIGRHSIGILHDLSSPLNTILLDLTDPSAHDTHKNLTRAVSAAEKMMQCINSGKKQVSTDSHLETFDIRKEVEEAVAATEYRQRHRNIAVSIDIANSTLLHTDRIGFYRTILNLISNAADAFSVSSANNFIRISAVRNNEGGVSLSVHDNGGGIDPKRVGRVFEPFFTTKPVGSGTGIGLTICKEFMEASGGEIALNSLIPGETTFTLHFPPAKLGTKNGKRKPNTKVQNL